MNHLKIHKGLKVKMRPLKNIRRSYCNRGDLWDYENCYEHNGDTYLKLLGRKGVVIEDVYDSYSAIRVKFEGIGKPVWLEYFEVMPLIKTLSLKEVYNA